MNYDNPISLISTPLDLWAFRCTCIVC